MTDLPETAAQPRLAETFAEAEDALLSRWPETKLEPSLDRISAFLDMLGNPQAGYPVIHLTGTNGKTSTSRMIDTLLRALDLRTGRFTSPHVERMSERISVDGEPLSDEEFVTAFNDVAPYLNLVDEESDHPLSFFETVVAMAYAKFAEAPVDVAVVEVGMGGSWDATNVADGAVAVVLPIAVDHARYLGGTPAEIAVEKAGIIKPGAVAVLAEQQPDVAEVLLARVAEVGATVVREGHGLRRGRPGAGGRRAAALAAGAARPLRRAVPPAVRRAPGPERRAGAGRGRGVPRRLATKPLDDALVRAAFAEVTSPARLEIVRRGPTIVLDAAHNPHGAEATAAALEDSFTLDPLIGVIGVMGDKDAEGLLAAFEPHLSHVVCTQNSTERAMPAEELAVTAREVFGEDRVTVEPRLADAIDRAVALAEEGSGSSSIGTGGVLVTGSVVTAGEARTMLKRRTS